MTDTLAARTTRTRDRRPLADVGAVPEQAPRIVWERVDTDRYRVSVDGVARGYVDVVGFVFVSLSGCRYDRAVEVAQSRDFARAIARVVEASAGSALMP